MATFETRPFSERISDLERRVKLLELEPVEGAQQEVHRLEAALLAMRERLRRELRHVAPESNVTTPTLLTLLIEQRDGWMQRAEAAEAAHQVTLDQLAEVEAELAEIKSLGLLSVDGEEINLGDEVRVERAKTDKYIGRIGVVKWKGVSNGWYHPRGVPLVRIHGTHSRFDRFYVPISDVRLLRS